MTGVADHGAALRLAAEQAALRRIATLVAHAAPPAEVFAQVAEELAKLFGDDVHSAVVRYNADATVTVVGTWGGRPPGGIRLDARLPVAGTGVIARVARERAAVRVDDLADAIGAVPEQAQAHGVRSAVGGPIVVAGRVWGAMVVARFSAAPFPPETEHRIAQFTELAATAVANAEAGAELQRLADEQAALRRVATLVARGAAPDEVFDAVVTEVARLLDAAQVGLARYEQDDEISVLAMRGHDPSVVGAGTRLPLDGESLSARVRATGRSGRLEHRRQPDGPIAEVVRRNDISVTVGAPIFVEGQLWGMIGASWKGDDRPAPEAEQRLAQFAELLDTAIANADTRAQLSASRARLVSAGDEARRRVVRDLHDGAQQRLVHTIITLKLAQRALDEHPAELKALVADALTHAEHAIADLGELAHGTLPDVLTRGGMAAGVDSTVTHPDLPVDVAVPADRFAPVIEASAYFVVAEALTNVVKHSAATKAGVSAEVEGERLVLRIRDDGVGGADPAGTGLTGLSDRVAAVGGSLRLHSPPGAGTELTMELPLRG